MPVLQIGNMMCLVRLVLLCLCVNLTITAKYVPGLDNSIADALLHSWEDTPHAPDAPDSFLGARGYRVYCTIALSSFRSYKMALESFKPFLDRVMVLLSLL